MSIVKMHNKKTGVTYVYESESYWDKELKQPRNRRRLIGKIDPATGEVVPTGRSGRKPAPKAGAEPGPEGTQNHDERYAELLAAIGEKDQEILALRNRLRDAEKRLALRDDAISRIKDAISRLKSERGGQGGNRRNRNSYDGRGPRPRIGEPAPENGESGAEARERRSERGERTPRACDSCAPRKVEGSRTPAEEEL